MVKSFSALFLILLLTTLLPAQPAQTVIKCGTLIDVKTGATVKGAFIVVEGNTVRLVGTNIPLPHEANFIDLSGMTVLPGLIDAHAHIALHAGNYDNQVIRETPEYRAIVATASAKATLAAGVTTIRDLGNEGSGYADIALRDAIHNGIVPGPRIFASILPVAPTGSYNLVGFSPYGTVPPISYAADGPAEIRKQVRRLIKEGADQIKVYIESYEKKQLSGDSLAGAMNFSDEELTVLVDEAHRAGVKVAAHTYSDSGARQAIAAGVNTIEHGLYLSEETFRRMATQDIYYVPTLLVYEYWRDGKIFGPASPETTIKLTNTVAKHIATFKRALSTGVKIVFGSDTFELPGTNPRELELMVDYGMKPVEALRAATVVAAELLGIDNMTGTIEPDQRADIIAVDGNPLQDMSVLRNVVFVMKDGKVYLSKATQ